MEATPYTMQRHGLVNALDSHDGTRPVATTMIRNDWTTSWLNPKNRIDSLAPLLTGTWSIDGGEADGSTFFAIPDFARNRRPLRIDTYAPPAQLHPATLREVLNPHHALHVRSTSVGRTAFARHLLRALEAWTYRTPDLEKRYFALPFGSRIIVNNVVADVSQMDIQLQARYDIERQLLSVKELQSLWNSPEEFWPPKLDHEQVCLVSQPYPTISLITVRGHGPSIFVLKSLPDDMKYFYHELKTLLTLPPHPNIMGRPLWIVTKKCLFGSKRGVCGFVLEHHAGGTLREALESQRKFPFAQRLDWALALIDAFVHISKSSLKFYTNLKLNNIVMTKGRTKPVLIDFEQRLGPSAWAPPEVYLVSYLAQSAEGSTCHRERTQHTELLRRYIPEWQPLKQSARYDNAAHGYCQPWPTLLAEDKYEASQVFLLGKLLWCLFEHQSTLNIQVTLDSFRENEASMSFPEFSQTPDELCSLIFRCTAGAPEWEGKQAGVVREGSRLVSPALRSRVDVPEAEVAAVFDGWWAEQREAAVSHVDMMAKQRLSRSNQPQSAIAMAMRTRPRLTEVWKILQDHVDRLKAIKA